MLTTSIELVGFLLFVAAVVVLAWPYSVPGALAAGGVLLLALSWLIDARKKGGKP